MNRNIKRMFPFFFIVVGAIVGLLGVSVLIRANNSVNWPTVQGEVVKSSVVEYSGSNRTYSANIVYKFTVNDKKFRGGRIAYGDYSSGDSTHADQIAKRYPAGKSVTVHYMPGNPKECLLESGVQKQAWIPFVFGLIFTAAGFLIRYVTEAQYAAEQSSESDSGSA